MTWSDSSGDTFDSAALSSGLFNAAGVQVKGTCGASYVTDVIRVERAGIESAIKILTPAAARDPEIVSRFLKNARYNQSLNDFTGMKIIEIVEKGPRPYYVMERVAESSLLEVIRLHAPIDPHWLASLLVPVARSLDTIHQRNVLHANIKPSNLLVVVDDGKEKFLLVDYLEPSLAATSATIMGAGIYAAPEFRYGTPVSNRSDIYSLAAVLYEGLAARTPDGAYRMADGTFHAWRTNDRPLELSHVNPEISKTVSDVVMSGLSVQAISRPSSASMMVEEVLRHLEEPRTRVRVDEPKEQHEHTPVPMLLITVGVFLAIILLFGAVKVVGGFFTGSDSPTTTVAQSSSTTPSDGTPVTEAEPTLYSLLPSDQQSCRADRTSDDTKRWPVATAILDCETSDLSKLSYGLFSRASDVEDTYIQLANYMKDLVEQSGGRVEETLAGAEPCSATPNESGQWGSQDGNTGRGGRYTCVTSPSPRIIWYEKETKVLGDAELTNGSIDQLIQWWVNKSGPA